MWRLLQITLFNLIEGVGRMNSFILFPVINTLPSNDQMKIFIYSTYPFLLQPPILPTELINHVFSWKSKLK